MYVSGGAGRNSLWQFTLAGGSAATTSPLATVAEPIYDMAFDGNGQLWATTGGGPLVQLDPSTGQIIASYGEGIELGMAADPNSNDLYVATGNGIEVFNTVTHVFQPFSSSASMRSRLLPTELCGDQHGRPADRSSASTSTGIRPRLSPSPTQRTVWRLASRALRLRICSSRLMRTGR